MRTEEIQRYGYQRPFAWLYLAAIGLIFGGCFSAIGFVAAGAGHGTYIPIGIFSSPLWILGPPVALFGPPFLWAFIGVLCHEMLESGNKRGLFLIVMGLHFGCLPWIICKSMFANGDYFWDIYKIFPLEITIGFVLYGLAQAMVWNCFVVACIKRPPQFGIRALLVVTTLFAIWLSWTVIVVRDPFAATGPDQNPETKIAEKRLVQPERGVDASKLIILYVNGGRI